MIHFLPLMLFPFKLSKGCFTIISLKFGKVSGYMNDKKLENIHSLKPVSVGREGSGGYK